MLALTRNDIFAFSLDFIEHFPHIRSSVAIIFLQFIKNGMKSLQFVQLRVSAPFIAKRRRPTRLKSAPKPYMTVLWLRYIESIARFEVGKSFY